MDRLFAERFYGIPWTLLALIALAVTIVFLVIDLSAGASGLRWIVVRWGHALVWLLLMLGALAMSRITPLPVAWAGPLAAAGGVLYLVFLGFSLSGRS